jgi:hypothetical protein
MKDKALWQRLALLSLILANCTEYSGSQMWRNLRVTYEGMAQTAPIWLEMCHPRFKKNYKITTFSLSAVFSNLYLCYSPETS